MIIRGRRRSSLMRRMAVIVPLAFVTTAIAYPGQAAVSGVVHPPAVQQVPVHQRSSLTSPHVSIPTTPRTPVTGTAWPTAGAGTADLSGDRGAGVRAGRLPVVLRRDTGAAGARTAAGTQVGSSTAQPVSVNVLSHMQAAAAGVAGVLFTVAAGSGNTPGRLQVGVDYSTFRNAVGGNWAGRLRLVQLPACALTTPQLPACQVQTPLASVDNAANSTVSAPVSLPSAISAGHASSAKAADSSLKPTQPAMVMALLSGASGSNGDFTAASLSPSGTWSAGGSSGDFTWSYPLSVPKPAAGAAPPVALAYNSADVDGRIASTNNQFGQVGEGWTLSNSYIARSYVDCADDPEGAIANDYDTCWPGQQVVTMSLDGRSTPLLIDSSGTWHEQQDSRDSVQYLTGTASDTANGTYDNGYWLVTTPDGTQYYFGKNRGPGWASGDAQTNSAWTEPVYGAHSGDPCYKASGFAQSSCAMAWQWNLDFVIDPHGNATIYTYGAETNYYGADNETTGVQYDRGGYPVSIQYGIRDESGSVYAGTAPQQVTFTTAQRCIVTKTFSCDPSQFTSTNAANWPDTPQDQQCLSGATCNNHSPTFWSTMRVTGINTQYYTGTAYATVDNYALAQEFSTQGDNELLLDSITRTGNAAGTSLALPPVNFTYQLMNNRVPGYNSQPSMAHWRLTNLQTETGEKISVTYNQTCSASNIPSDASANTGLCYPVSWTRPGDTNPILDYFNKYVVAQVEVQDTTAGDPAQFTDYTYVNGAAWHYDDNQLVKAKNRTYGQFRGYGEVDTLFGDTNHISNGAADLQSETKTFYYRGMDGDVLPGGKTRSASVSDTLGSSYVDNNAFAGQKLETQKLLGVGGAELSASITELSVAETTGSEAVSGLPTMYATKVRPAIQKAYTDLATGGTEVKQTTTSYDGQGRPVLADTTGTGIPESCTQTSYTANSAGTITDVPDETITAAQPCPASPGNLTTTSILTDARTYFDGSSTLGQITGPADPTMVSKAVTNTAGTLSFTPLSAATYDAMGRVLTVKNARGNAATIAYTPTDGGPLTQKQTTDALGHKATIAYDPARGTVLSSTDIAGYVTSATYDALGRTTAVWEPGRNQGQVLANVTYAYRVSQSTPLAVTTNTLVDTGTSTDYVTAIAIYDALGQQRQTQTMAEGGNTVVTDTSYDSHGWAWQTSNNYVVSGAPSTVIATVAPSAANDRTVITFDATGRAVLARAYNGLSLTSSTQTIYSGNSVTTLKHDPSGTVIGSPSTTAVDVNGNTIESDEYSSAPSVNGNIVTPSVSGSRLATTTSYDALGRKTQVQSPGGANWTYQYDMLGRLIQATDPDSGTTSTTYDADGDIASTTDANGTKNNYVYDALDRKSAEYTGSTTQGSGTEIGAWFYDTLKAGRLSYEKAISPSTGAIYASGISGYDPAGNVGGQWVQIPASVTGLAGTYRTSYIYTTTGQMLSLNPAGGGNLPGDVQTFTYDQYGNPVSDKGLDTYVDNASYTPFDAVSQLNLGTGPSAAALTYSYDPQSRRETGITLSDTQPSPQVDATTYTYNAAQQLTSSTDTQGASGSAPVENQCFTYDLLNRLTAAWSATDQCATNPYTTGSNATIGGPEPYAQSWTFNNDGQRTSETDLPSASSTAGTTTTNYTYGATGHAHALTSTSNTNSVTGPAGSASYTYDNNGNTKTRGTSSETLSWDPNGKLASDTNANGGTSLTYDADGKLLIESDPASSTLYLPSEQLTYNTVSKTLSGIQYYTFGGLTIAEGTGTALYWLEGNTQGSMSVALNAFNQANVTRRTLTPYGAPAIRSNSWVDNRGMLGDPQQPGTGLENIGARTYDPTIGAFISVDPVLETGDSSQINGYAYSGDDPTNGSDPTGLTSCAMVDGDFCAGSGSGSGGSTSGSGTNADDSSDPGWTVVATGSGADPGKIYYNPLNPFNLNPLAPTFGTSSPLPSTYKGSISIDDIETNPNILQGMSPEELIARLTLPEGWKIEVPTQGQHSGIGLKIMQYIQKPSARGGGVKEVPGNGMIKWQVSARAGKDGAYWRVNTRAAVKSDPIKAGESKYSWNGIDEVRANIARIHSTGQAETQDAPAVPNSGGGEATQPQTNSGGGANDVPCACQAPGSSNWWDEFTGGGDGSDPVPVVEGIA